jgi:hypothetical protein
MSILTTKHSPIPQDRILSIRFLEKIILKLNLTMTNNNDLLMDLGDSAFSKDSSTKTSFSPESIIFDRQHKCSNDIDCKH